MKILRIIAVCALLLIAASSQAKRPIVGKMYMFGFAASFNDTIVHITDIQEVDSAWSDSKSRRLLGCEQYSYQLRDFLSENQQMPHRTCVVFYHHDRKKLEKKYSSLTRLYYLPKDGQQHYDIRRLEKGQFLFRQVNMSEEVVEEETGTPPPPTADKNKKPKKGKKRGKQGE